MRKLALLFLCFCALTIDDAAGVMSGNGLESADKLISGGRYAEAVAAYQHISKTSPDADDRAEALLLEGVVRGFALGDPLAATECFEKILLLYPKSLAAADALFQSAVLYYGQGRFDLAQAAFTEYVAVFPEGPRHASAKQWLARTGPKVDQLPIRVLIADRMDRVSIRSEKKLIVQDAATGRRIYPGASALLIRAGKGGLSINGRMTTRWQLRVRSSADVMTVNECVSRGTNIISVTDEGLRVISQIPVEQYLYGTIPGEMPHTWSGEALMAQAVASRTYALYIREQNRHLPYDVAASIASQVYGGVDAEKASTTVAVDATRGQVMTFNGRLIAAYYHADSGGHTEDVRYVWNVDIPYLKGSPDRYSRKGSGSDWRQYLSFTRIGTLLRQAGVTVGTVRGINILEKSPTGRVLRIEVVSDQGNIEMSGNHFRVNLGSTAIKSTCFQIAPEADGVLLIGKGYGHGVGMSQRGASQMAQAGFTYKQILEFYYPGTTLSNRAIACRNL